MKYLFLFCFLLSIFSVNAKDIEEFPSSICTNQSLRIKVTDLSLCMHKKDVTSIDFLGLSSHTAVINNDISVAINPPNISIANLHKKLNLSVHDFFMRLLNDSINTNRLSKIKQALNLDDKNQLKAFHKQNLYAFVITGSNNDYDRIYLNKKDSEVIYQITGEFSLNEALKILSTVEY